jgi:2-methylcitrate dehydratase PrpD
VTGHDVPKLEALAAFAHRFDWADVADADRHTFRAHVLDTLGCAIGTQRGDPVVRARRVIDALGGAPQCTRIGGGRTSLPNTAFHNGALVRYLDFMDTFLAAPFADDALRREIVAAVADLDAIDVADLTRPLAAVSPTGTG